MENDEIIIESLKMIGGIAAFVWGLNTYIKSEKWKKIEFVNGKLDKFNNDIKVQRMLLMLDWSSRHMVLTYNEKELAINYSYDLLRSSLIPHNVKKKFFPEEAAVREAFDHFLNYLNEFHYLVKKDTIQIDDLDSSLSYWLNLIGNPNSHLAQSNADTLKIIHYYISFYGNDGAIDLIKMNYAFNDDFAKISDFDILITNLTEFLNKKDVILDDSIAQQQDFKTTL